MTFKILKRKVLHEFAESDTTLIRAQLMVLAGAPGKWVGLVRRDLVDKTTTILFIMPFEEPFVDEAVQNLLKTVKAMAGGTKRKK